MNNKISFILYQPPSFGSKRLIKVTGYSHDHVIQVHAHTLNFEMLVSEIFVTKNKIVEPNLELVNSVKLCNNAM